MRDQDFFRRSPYFSPSFMSNGNNSSNTSTGSGIERKIPIKIESPPPGSPSAASVSSSSSGHSSIPQHQHSQQQHQHHQHSEQQEPQHRVVHESFPSAPEPQGMPARRSPAPRQWGRDFGDRVIEIPIKRDSNLGGPQFQSSRHGSPGQSPHSRQDASPHPPTTNGKAESRERQVDNDSSSIQSSSSQSSLSQKQETPASKPQQLQQQEHKQPTQQQQQQQPQSVSSAGRKTSMVEIGDKLVGMLDEIERRVENLRETASLMEQEKESLLDMLAMVSKNKDMLRLEQGEKDDIEATTDRLITRCKTVDVTVTTPRNPEQEQALRAVYAHMDDLKNKMQQNPNPNHLSTCHRYLNACAVDQPDGPVDFKFQSLIIGCTAEDQKRIRKNLGQLVAAYSPHPEEH